MHTLNSWENEDNEVNWIHYNYKFVPKKSSKNESEAQRSFRMKFSIANSILNQIRQVIKLSFVKHNKGRKSGYNKAVGLFLSNAIRGDYPNLEVNFSAMEVSKGTLPGLYQWKFSVNDNEISLTWDSDISKHNAYGNDEVFLVLFNISEKSFPFVIDNANRSDEKIDYLISKSEKGDYAAWSFVMNIENTNSSNSHFLGIFSIDE